MNMSYCRFRNTNTDLQDCLDTLNDGEKIDGEELAACKDMFENFLAFCCDEGIVTEANWKIEERLQEFYEQIQQ